MDDAAIASAFSAHGKWISRFLINGIAYGGSFDPMNDPRLPVFWELFPGAETILELGALEGGHTIALARAPGVKRVVGVEGRAENLARAKLAAELLDAKKVEFVHANLEEIDLRRFGHFDAIFCTGLLYHLPEPWKLLRQFPTVSPRAFFWTHYCRENEADVMRENYRGRMQGEHGIAEPLSGLSAASFWPTLTSFQKMLSDAGYSTVKILNLEPDQSEGPAVAAIAYNLA